MDSTRLSTTTILLAVLLLYGTITVFGFPRSVREAWIEGRDAVNQAVAELDWHIQHGAMP